MDTCEKIGAIILMLLCLGTVIIMFDLMFIKPYAAEDAMQQCRAEGANSYLSYTRVIFSPKALGVKCEYPIKNYNIDGQGIGLVAME